MKLTAPSRLTSRVAQRIFLISFFILHSSFFITPVAQAQGGFIPTPGQSCERLADPAERTECNKAICPQGKMCAQGKCARLEKNKPVDVAAATLPCNYTIEDFVESGVRLATFIFGIAGSLTLLFFAYGGYTMFTSFGNPEEIQKGRKILTGAFVGLVLILSAGLFVQFIAGLVLPKGGKEISPGLVIPAGEKACTTDAQCGPGSGWTCFNQVCRSKCEVELGNQGYTCQTLTCLEKEDCGPGLQCAKGWGCVTEKEAQSGSLPKVECKKDKCPGNKYAQCCRVMPK